MTLKEDQSLLNFSEQAELPRESLPFVEFDESAGQELCERAK